MRSLSRVLLMPVSIIVITNVTTSVHPNTVEFKVDKARLQLMTSIVSERSCRPEHFSLKLRFTFKNIGNEPLIVDKRSIIMRHLISKSLTAAAAKKYLQISESHQWGDYFFEIDPSDMTTFVIIPPGESYDLETGQTRVTVGVTEDEHRPKDDVLPGSRYFLQVEVATWTYYQDPKTFKKAWSKKGYLWYEGLISEPMPFIVSENRPIVKCS